ncbi:hypothetical protein AVEN_194814-1 [Araneus ventricosus]|uniref:Cuticle protein 16.8 n=1 Tax=Araneus ventricosus TaxID=182803 RepID=A0A4Y2B421_ARAVE|nr:hypothetical protein AVEN_194814-1 [Araneus ventricosus]
MIKLPTFNKNVENSHLALACRTRDAGSLNNRCLCVNRVCPILNLVRTVSSFLIGTGEFKLVADLARLSASSLPDIPKGSTCESFSRISLVIAFIALAGVAVAQHLPAHHAPVHHAPVHHAPQPYAFGYRVKDHHGEQHRQEAGDGHGVKGSYGFTDDRGIHRQVNYVADHAGFRAQVKTNEPGTANQNPAAVHMISDAPYAHGHHGHHGVVPVVNALVGGASHGSHVHRDVVPVVVAPAHYGHHGYGYVSPHATYGYAGVPYGHYGYGLPNGFLGGLGHNRYGH